MTPARPSFLDDDFLLSCARARQLYHEFAEPCPIVDYHCHLPVAQIAEDHAFADITELWLGGDHYKWRAMRTAGVDEQFITGNAPSREKFQKFAETVPLMLRNPVYHWTHMEMRRPFGITDRLLDAETAESVWRDTGACLALPAFTAQGLIQQFNVAVVCTTDDPTDDLRHHAAIPASNRSGAAVFPTFRPDAVFASENPAAWNAWVDRLGAVTGRDIRTPDDLLAALANRCDYFHRHGCRLSDHGFEQAFADDFTGAGASEAFALLRAGTALSPEATARLRSFLLHHLGLLYAERGWVMQLHLGALRNNNRRLAGRIGADSGFDAIADAPQARALARFLDRLDEGDHLPRTILYNLNPADNELFATLAGCFQDGSVRGKVQYGSAWWFLDQRDGILRQVEALSSMGLLGCFVGMLTDSRSFLSYSRHEYFRRILCNLLGSEMEQGLLPDEPPLIGTLVKRVCHENARDYFRFPNPLKEQQA